MAPIEQAELAAAYHRAFASLGQDRAADAATVVLAWPSVPVELVRAAGFNAVVAKGGEAPTPLADEHLEPGVFPSRLHHLVEAALSDRLADVAAIVIPRTSDPDYKCFLYLRELARQGIGPSAPPVLLLDMLQSPAPAAIAYNRSRLAELFDTLCALPGARTTREGIAGELHNGNGARAAGRALQARRANTPVLRGADALPLLGAFWNMPPERYTLLAQSAAQALATRPVMPCTRVLVAGAPVDGDRLHAAIEARHAVVVDEISPNGCDAVREDVLPGPDPLQSLARYYRDLAGAARLPVQTARRRFDSALRQVDAVVVALPADDASFGWDYPLWRARLADTGIPHVVVKTDGAGTVSTSDLRSLSRLLDRLDAAEVTHG